MATQRMRLLRLVTVLAVCLLVATSLTTAEEECSGQGKIHGNHCHCNKGYKSKGVECVPIEGGAAGATCPAGGIAWEASTILYLEQGSYTIELINNTDNMAVLVLPLVNVSEPTAELLETSQESATLLVEDITLPRKLVKNKQVMAPSNNLLYVVLRNNADELAKAKEECEKTPGSTWHIDHCDGPGGHGTRRRRLADEAKTTVNLTITTTAYYAVHMQHNAMEEFGMQILDRTGKSVTALVTKTDGEDEDADSAAQPRKATGAVWLKTMGAVTVVALLSIIGLMLLSLRVHNLNRIMDALMALSAGALFGAAFMHILPEAIEFYSVYGQMEMMICVVFTAGFLIAMVVEMFLEVMVAKYGQGAQHHGHGDGHHDPSTAVKLLTPSSQEHAPSSAASPLPVGGPTPNSVVAAFQDMETASAHHHVLPAVAGAAAPHKYSLHVEWTTIKPMAYIILLGDLFHNFVDGVLIATAFLACDDALGIAVTTSAILHEIPQEFADYIILVDSGFTSFQAVLFNFLSALSAYLGAAIILSSITVTKTTMGLLLGFGAGTLVYIAATDLLPRVLRARTFGDFFLRIFLFSLGVVLIGLTTLHHVHCEAEF